MFYKDGKKGRILDRVQYQLIWNSDEILDKKELKNGYTPTLGEQSRNIFQ